MYETFETEKHLLYVEELCVGGDLLTYVRKRRRLKENVAKVILKQILDGLFTAIAKKYCIGILSLIIFCLIVKEILRYI